MTAMPGAWRCELHRLWTTGDCPDCDADLIALTETEMIAHPTGDHEPPHRELRAGDPTRCSCGRPAAAIFLTEDHGQVPTCR